MHISKEEYITQAAQDSRFKDLPYSALAAGVAYGLLTMTVRDRLSEDYRYGSAYIDVNDSRHPFHWLIDFNHPFLDRNYSEIALFVDELILMQESFPGSLRTLLST